MDAKRPYSNEQVEQLRGSLRIEHTLAHRAAGAAARGGSGYFDEVAETISGGDASTRALSGSTEEAQFN